MQRAHSPRTRRPPRASDDCYHQGAQDCSYGYDGRDLRELDELIAAKCKVPRAELSSRVEDSPAAVLRRVIGRELVSKKNNRD
jgi:hypothetical protein